MGQPASPRAHPLCPASPPAGLLSQKPRTIRPLVLDARDPLRACVLAYQRIAYYRWERGGSWRERVCVCVCVRGWLGGLECSRERREGRGIRPPWTGAEGERVGRRRRVSGEEKSGERGWTKERKKQNGDRGAGLGREGVSLELSCRRMRALRLAAEGEARQRLLIRQDPPTNPR